MNGHLAIEARQLTERYGGVTAVDGFDLAVTPGTVVSLLGPNGAGKTTVVRMLATLAQPTSGSAEVFGYDIGTQAGGGAGRRGHHAAAHHPVPGRGGRPRRPHCPYRPRPLHGQRHPPPS
jgi:ABC-2 type transport system ATP-binding protein